jgi:hypothetical protein
MGEQWESNGRAMEEQWESDGRAMGERWESDGRAMGADSRSDSDDGAYRPPLPQAYHMRACVCAHSVLLIYIWRPNRS